MPKKVPVVSGKSFEKEKLRVDLYISEASDEDVVQASGPGKGLVLLQMFEESLWQAFGKPLASLWQAFGKPLASSSHLGPGHLLPVLPHAALCELAGGSSDRILFCVRESCWRSTRRPS